MPSKSLTMRETEVLIRLAGGQTCGEIADDISRSCKTIEAHKTNLMRKLDIHSRAALVHYAIEVGAVGIGKCKRK